MPPAMKRLLADLQLPANRFDRRALVEVHLRLAQLRNDLLRRVSLPFHRVLPPSRAVRLSYQLVHLVGVRSVERGVLHLFRNQFKVFTFVVQNFLRPFTINCPPNTNISRTFFKSLSRRL